MPKRPASDEADLAVAVRIRLRRRQLGLRQADLAQALGVTIQTIQKQEAGQIRVTGSALVKLASRLATTVGALVGECDLDGVTPEILAHLAPLDSVRLLGAYAAIDLPEDRSLVLRMAQALSRESPTWDAHDGPEPRGEAGGCEDAGG